MNKRQLYEHLMHKIAKIVNEVLDDEKCVLQLDGSLYHKSAWHHGEEDWQEGGKYNYFINTVKGYMDILHLKFTSLDRNNFRRAKIFNSIADAGNFIQTLKEKCEDNGYALSLIDRLKIISYAEMQDNIKDADSAKAALDARVEAQRAARRKADYEYNKERNAEREKANAAINPGTYSVTFRYAQGWQGSETFTVQAESINDAFIKAKAKALRQDPNRDCSGYDERMIFNKSCINKIN